MRTLVIVVFAVFVTTLQAGQDQAGTPDPPRPSAPTALAALEVEGDQDDPAFAAYKKGYALILDERWNEARKTFAEVLAKHPKSGYADDAGYWSAYALMHQDHEQARVAYQQFIESNRHSSYFDDAVADLAQIQAGDTATTAPDAFGYSFSFGPRTRDIERELRRAHRSMSRLRLGPAGSVRWPTLPAENEEPDPETRLKIEALYALAESREDEQTFQTLKVIVLDAKQPLALREAAIDGLAGSTKHDVLPILAEIARKDTHQTIQAYAIDVISQGKDRDKSVMLLIDLFGKLPGDRKEPVECVFYAIAGVGNDRAIDFLKTVALTHREYNLRRDAVYYLGNIGGERARAALCEILKSR